MVENIAKFPEHIKLNDYAIKQKKGKQSFFKLIYSLGQVELKILKTYIEINLANDLIQTFKYPNEALIFYDQKLNQSVCLCIKYQGLNNFIVKN